MGLAETAVALVILAVGWGALLALHDHALRTLLGAEFREEVRWTLQAVADSLVGAGGEGAGRREMPWGWVEWRGESGGTLLEAWTERDGAVENLWVVAGGPRP